MGKRKFTHKKTVIDFKHLGERLIFENPLEELSTKSLNKVRSILNEVEDYQKQGYYVVGYVSYEAAKAFEEKFTVKQSSLSAEYLAYFTVHKNVRKSTIPLSYIDVPMPDTWRTNTSEEEYANAISQIKSNIRQGNTYQVNYTVQLEAELEADAFSIYNRLVVEQGAAYNAYIEHDDFAVISSSPELFFERYDQTLITRPMKGTTNRGITYQDDLDNKNWLFKDPKNRAENMMIADLLRNDMGRISQVGSVKVNKLCEVEQYSTVWQMTSTIESQLQLNVSLSQIFQALFPCGSITGAPKISTMSIIDELEPSPRGIYCGTIGICLPSGDSIFNVAIRTLQVKDNHAIYGVGGGITWDSDWKSEYEEIKQKSAILYRKQANFDLITTGKLSQGEMLFLEEHLIRLEKAARYFAYPFDKKLCLSAIKDKIVSLDQTIDYRLKVLLAKDGRLRIEVAKLEELSIDFLKAIIVERQEADTTPFVTFKTSYRPHIPKAKTEQIFIASDGYLQETAIGNLVLDINGKLLTPPVSVGLLDGIYRRYLLQTNQMVEAHLTKEDLKRADHIYACNSVRGLYELTIEGGIE